MARGLAVALLRPVFEHPYLVALDVLGDNRVHLHLGELSAVEDDVVGSVQERFRRHLGALLRIDAVDKQRVALLDPVLLAAHLDDRVRHALSLSLSGRRGLAGRGALGARTPPSAPAATAALARRAVRFYLLL